MKLFNTLTRQKETFKPLEKGRISMYNCGPTVYWDVHTGNLRAYTAWDVLARYLRWKGYELNRIMNFTDIGHMTDDDDFGDDKIEKRARERELSPQTIALEYIARILEDFALMNIETPSGHNISELKEIETFDRDDWAKYGFAPATAYIKEMIEVIEKIYDNGFAYETDQAVYFDTTKFPDYWKMSGQKLSEKDVAMREEVTADPAKRNPADFVLWMKAVGKYEDHIMRWGGGTQEAPLECSWGEGFPGWHIECTAMSGELLGKRFDIHTGGTDHIPVHHTNEIAQSWGAFGHFGASYWLHNEMVVDKEGSKASKSKKNVYFLSELLEKGFEPMDLRYYFLTVNYRKPMGFTFDGLRGARNSRLRLIERLKDGIAELDAADTQLLGRFEAYMDDNLNTAGALALLNEILSDVKYSRKAVEQIDTVLGLGLVEAADKSVVVPGEIKQLADKRVEAKKAKNYELADSLRDKIEKAGWEIQDSGDQYKLRIKR